MERSYWQPHRQRSMSRRTAIGRGLALGGGSLAAAWLAACGGSEDKPSTGAATAASGSTQAAGADSKIDLNATLRAAIPSDLGALDPQTVTGVANIPNTSTHFSGPLSTDPETRSLVPQTMAFKWVDNNTAIEFKIAPNVTFHNGEQLTAEVLKFNYDRLGEKTAYNRGGSFKSGRAYIPAAFTGEPQILDQLTLKVPVKPDVGFPGRLTYNLVPKAVLEQKGDDDFARNPVGSGPFKFVSRTPDLELRSTRYDNYFIPRDAKYGPRLPYIKDLIQIVRPEPQAQLAALEAGEVDIVWDTNPDLVKPFNNRKGFKVMYVPDGTGLHVQFNTHPDTDPRTGGANPWRDIRVRRAANMAVDVDAIIKNLLTGKESPSFGASTASFGFPKDITSKRFKFDPRAAKQLLTEAGYPNGIDCDFYIGTGRVANTDTVALAVQSNLKDIGIRANIKQQTFTELLPFMRDMKLPGLFMFTVNNLQEPTSTMEAEYRTGGIYTKSTYPETRIDAVYDKQLLEFDPDQRRKTLAELWHLFYDNASWLFLYETVRAGVMKENIVWEPFGLPGSHAEYWNIKVMRT